MKIFTQQPQQLLAPFPLSIMAVNRARKVIQPLTLSLSLTLTHSRNQIANRQEAAGGSRRQQSAPGGSQLADSGSSAISAASGTAEKGVPREWLGGGGDRGENCQFSSLDRYVHLFIFVAAENSRHSESQI